MMKSAPSSAPIRSTPHSGSKWSRRHIVLASGRRQRSCSAMSIDYRHWARHLLRLRELQMRTGGFTEFVPLPFVPMETPIHLRGLSRLGPTFREAVLMHAVGRLVLNPLVTNIQTSWVKMGAEGAAVCLRAGANDLGGTLMNESITRAAGAFMARRCLPKRWIG